ncbi:hypothetical protein BYT27DRAFT_7189007 [Phlegmacium glaucopus]|nr:hypothetical protein BYT27DRAFT_7189007 [Phlegmacium glaucopus]
MALGPSVELVFGPMLIGTYINMILYGILIVQMYHYYKTYKQDSKWIRYFILYLFVMETFNSICDIAMMFQPLIQEFGKPNALKFFPTMFAAEPIVIVCISTPIQLFFAWRIWVLTRNYVLAAIVVFFSLVSLGGGIWTTVLLIHLKLFALKPKLHWPALMWFISAVIADVLITSVLVYNLSKRKTGFSGTDDAIEKIIRMTVQTGMLTAFCAIADVIFFLSLPHTALNFVWDIALAKLYANCLMSTLNARSGLHDLISHKASAQRYVSSVAHRQQDTILEANCSSNKTSTQSDVEYGITVTKVVETRKEPDFTRERYQ